jgi:hypothetical protein
MSQMVKQWRCVYSESEPVRSICYRGSTSMVSGDGKQHGFLLERRGGDSNTSIIEERLSGIAYHCKYVLVSWPRLQLIAFT